MAATSILANIVFKSEDNQFNVSKLYGTEHLSKPFLFSVQIITDFSFDSDFYLGKPATLNINEPNNSGRNISGIITSINEQIADDASYLLVSFSLEPKMVLAKFEKNVRVFLNDDVITITKKILTDLGLLEKQLQFHLTKTYAPKPVTTQVMNESNLEFLQRILAKAGIFFWFEDDLMHFANENKLCPFVADSNAAFIPPSGLQQNSKLCFWRLEFSNQAVTTNSNIIDHNETLPEHSILASHKFDKNLQQTLYGSGAKFQEQAEAIAQLHSQQKSSEACKLRAWGNLIQLIPGFSLSLIPSQFTQDVAGDYLIQGIEHFAEQNIEHKRVQLPYSNKVILHPRGVSYRDPIPSHSKIPTATIAHVESNSDYAHLDANSAYQVRAHFDISDSAHTEAMPPLMRLAPYGGPTNESANPQVGVHMPIHDNTEVIMGNINGDPDRPILLGTMSNSSNYSPVTANNSSQNRIVTAAANELCMDDRLNQEQVILTTKDKKNILHMDASKDKHNFTLASNEGALNFITKKTTNIQSDGSSTEAIANNRELLVENNDKTITNKAEIHYQSAVDHIVLAKENIRLQAAKNIELTCKREFKLDAEENANISIKGDYASFTIDKGNLFIESADEINIIGDGAGDIEFSQNGAGFSMRADGAVDLFGNNINMKADSGVVLNGNVNYVDAPGVADAALTLPAVLFRKTIDDLKLNPNTQITDLIWDKSYALVTDTINASFHFSGFQGNETGKLKVYAKDQDEYKQIDTKPFMLTAETGELSIPWQYHGGSNMQKSDTKKAECIDYCFKIEIGDSESNKYSSNVNLLKQVVINTYYPLASEKLSATGAALLEASVGASVSAKAGEAVPQACNLGYLVSGKAEFGLIPNGSVLYALQSGKRHIELLDKNFANPYSQAVIKIPDDNKTPYECEQACLYPPIICNLRLDAGNAKDKLLPEEIKYFQQNGNNALIFIHGFNVEFGAFSKHIATAADATTLRTAEQIKQRFPEFKEQDLENLNGTGAHNWFISMEDNLNRATGEFDRSNYKKFTRLVNITWSGDPSAYNYMTAVDNTVETGKKLSAVIEQLLAADIEVSVIAHSLGNGVLLQAMNRLPANALEHIFMWEAAMPNNIFDPENKRTGDEHYDSLWYVPHAYKAAKKITILYSQNDNVLGPIPPNQPNQDVINKDKPLSELLPALLLTNLGLESLYAIAMWVGVPATDLFNQDALECIYQNWRKSSANSDPMLAERLSEETKRMKRDPSATMYEDLRNKLESCEDKINQQLKDAGYTKEAFAAKVAAGVLENIGFIKWLVLSLPVVGPEVFVSIKVLEARLHLEDVLTLIYIMLYKTKFKPVKALGYMGADENSRKNRGKLHTPVNQAPWLWSHSGMKIPRKSLMDNVYKRYIINKQSEHGLGQFGKYY